MNLKEKALRLLWAAWLAFVFIFGCLVVLSLLVLLALFMHWLGMPKELAGMAAGFIFCFVMITAALYDHPDR